MYEIIHDVNEVQLFFDKVLPPLEKTEVYFVSLSARNKYLSPEEREEYGLGRTEMFERRLIRYSTWERFLRTIRKFETNDGSYLTKKGKVIPQDCMICYININPSDTLKAYREFNKIMNDYMYELSQCAINGRPIDDITNRINKMNTLLMNCFQKNRGIKHWIDVDFDIPKTEIIIIKHLTDFLSKKKIKYCVIDTRSGFHVTIDRHTLNSNFHDTLDNCRNEMFNKYKETIKWEIEVNKNEMVPLPGTWQGAYPVKIREIFS
jgi:hypothetical protein